MAEASTRYTPPKPVGLPADFDRYLASLDDRERELMEIARVKLGSSYFGHWTHSYRKWKAKQTAAASTVPTAGAGSVVAAAH